MELPLSHPGNTSEQAAERGSRRPGRVRAAWLALTGHPVVPDQLRAEWAAWAIELEDLADKVAKGAAKLLQRDRRELEAVTKERDELRAQVDSGDGLPASFGDGGGYSPLKRALNRRRLGLGATNGAAHVGSDQGEQG